MSRPETFGMTFVPVVVLCVRLSVHLELWAVCTMMSLVSTLMLTPNLHCTGTRSSVASWTCYWQRNTYKQQQKQIKIMFLLRITITQEA